MKNTKYSMRMAPDKTQSNTFNYYENKIHL